MSSQSSIVDAPVRGKVHNPRREAALDGLRVLGGLVALMWVVQLVNSVDSYKLDSHGIVPRSISGLQGVAFAPFLHASWAHLLGNTLPFVVLGAVIAFDGVARFLQATLIIIVVAGLGTWLTASSGSVTVGASGVVFGYAAYLIARGVFNRRASQLLLGALVAVLFGASLLWDLLPHHGISWQDHLFGAIGGVLAAWMISQSDASAKGSRPSK